MNSFKNNEKIIYPNFQDEIISLKEYLLFQDENSQGRFALFKFYNTIDQKLFKFKFEVAQYNDRNELIEKNILECDSLEAEPNHWFVPQNKLLLNPNYSTLKVKLLEATFEKIQWKDDRIEKIPLSLNQVKAEFESAKDEEKEKKSRRKFSEEEEIENKKEEVPAEFSVINIARRSRNHLSNVLISLLCLSALVLTTFSILLFKKTSKQLSDNKTRYSIDYTLNEDDTLSLKKYTGSAAEITIPEKFQNKIIRTIGKNSFQGASVKKVTILAKSIAIEEHAFADCKNLTLVYAEDKVKNIAANAFLNCTSLETIEMEYAENLSAKAFYGCENLLRMNVANAQLNYLSLNGVPNIRELIYGNSLTQKFYDLFGSSSSYVPNTLISLKTNMPFISKIFFEGVNHIKEFSLLNANVVVEEGALDQFTLIGNHWSTAGITILNGIILALEEDKTHLVLPADVIDDRAEPDSYFQSFLDQYGSQITALEIKSNNVTLNAEFFKSFVRLEKLIIHPEVSFDPMILKECKNLREINLPAIADLRQKIARPELIEKIVLTNCLALEEKYFSDFIHLKEIEIFGSNINYAKNLFAGCTQLERVTAPNGNIQFNNLPSLKQVRLKNSGYTILNTKMFYSLPSLKEIILSSEITEINKNVISDCPVIENFFLPKEGIISGLPIIGEGCTSLKNIQVPSLGENRQTKYKEFNLSYRSTENLSIQSSLFLSKAALEGCFSMKSLEVEFAEKSDENDLSGLFQDLTSIESIILNQVNVKKLSDLFLKEIPKSLKTIQLDFNDSYVPIDFFENCALLENIILLNPENFDRNIFNHLLQLKNLYISNKRGFQEYIVNLDGMNLKHPLNFMLGEEVQYTFLNSAIKFYPNISLSSISYQLQYNNLQLTHEGSFLFSEDELNQLMSSQKDLLENSLDLTEKGTYRFEAYSDAKFINRLELPSFLGGNTIIYLKRVLNQ